MDKIDKNSELFRSKAVHSQKLGAKRGFFRSIPVRFFSDHERDDAFPEHIRSFNRLAYTKVMRRSLIFRSISVHHSRFFSYLCTGFDNRTSTTIGENGACPPTRSGLIHPLLNRRTAQKWLRKRSISVQYC